MPNLRLKLVISKQQKTPKLRTKQPMRKTRKPWKWSKRLKKGKKNSKD